MVLIDVVGSQEDVGAFPGILLVVALGEVVFEDAQGGFVVVDVVWAGDVVVGIFVGAVPPDGCFDARIVFELGEHVFDVANLHGLGTNGVPNARCHKQRQQDVGIHEAVDFACDINEECVDVHVGPFFAMERN